MIHGGGASQRPRRHVRLALRRVGPRLAARGLAALRRPVGGLVAARRAVVGTTGRTLRRPAIVGGTAARARLVAGRRTIGRAPARGLLNGLIGAFALVIVTMRGMLSHAFTRIYFDGEPGNAADPVLAAVPAERRHTLIARRVDDASGPAYRFDIHMQGPNETVFFDA